MKIKLVSDLHLEFSDINISNHEDCDVLVLAGDIMVSQDLYDHVETSYGMYSNINLADLGRRQQVALRYRDFLRRCSIEFPHVVYIAGNHEFYHGKWIQTIDILRDECAKYPNIYFLENDQKIINDLVFVGGTLWTDMNKGDPLTLHVARDMMNDYRTIRKELEGYTKLKPIDTAMRHRQTLSYFKKTIQADSAKKYVIVGHHSPSFLSCHPQYVNDKAMNGCYHSDLSDFILDHPQIVLWFHGHTHNAFDYMIGSTRIVCNPRGYEGYEPDTGWNPNMFIEINQ